MSTATKRQHLHRLRTDFEAFSRFLHVRPEEGGRVVPFRLLPGQRKVMEAAGNHRRVLILKGRRLGITTLYLARAMHLISTRPHMSALMTAHRDTDATKIFKAANLMHRYLPTWLKHERSMAQRREIDYSLMGSSLGVGTAAGLGVGRSDTLHFVHLTEASRYTGDTEDFLAGILEAARAGSVTLETTAKGAQGFFYHLWTQSKKNGGPWHCVFAPWWWDTRNTIPPLTPKQRRQFKLTDEEREWAEPNNLTPEQVVWYRLKTIELGRRVKQEYPCSDMEAFAVAGLHFFSQELVVRKARLVKPPIKLHPKEIPKDLARCRGYLKVWCRPEEDQRYVMAADPTDGTEHGSYAYASVHRRSDWEQVARIRARWGPKEFASYIKPLAVWYRKAFVAVELNRRECVRALLRDYHYRYLYYQRKADGTTRKEPGFWTDAGTRGMALDFFREAWEGIGGEEGRLQIHDPVVYAEMTTFEDQGGGRYAAGSGEEETDDGILTIAIVLQALQSPLPTYRQL